MYASIISMLPVIYGNCCGIFSAFWFLATRLYFVSVGLAVEGLFYLALRDVSMVPPLDIDSIKDAFICLRRVFREYYNRVCGSTCVSCSHFLSSAVLTLILFVTSMHS